MMNRAQRRANPELAKLEAQLKPLPFGPLYQSTIKMHLGKDALWGRPENAENKERHLTARAPDVIWQETILATSEMLGMGEDKFILGLLLNLINNMPDDARARFVAGVASGTGMSISREEGELVVTFKEGVFPPPGHETGPVVLPSGLVIPGKPIVVTA